MNIEIYRATNNAIYLYIYTCAYTYSIQYICVYVPMHSLSYIYVLHAQKIYRYIDLSIQIWGECVC